VNFDPFGDFDTRGYLRNIVKEKDRDIVRRLEHSSFTTGIAAAFSSLATRKILTYSDVLGTHKILFEAIYPWAGEDRLTNASELAVSKAGLMFANPNDIQRAVNFALQKGQDPAFMKAKPGEVMGYLAYGHPFLDGNGRTIMVVHSVLAQRAGISINWAATRKSDYLTALTNEIESPGKRHLDAYLKPFVGDAIADAALSAHVARAPGLDGNAEQNEVLGKTNEPAVQARYEQQTLKRKKSEESSGG
jgi:cell filamentation protein